MTKILGFALILAATSMTLKGVAVAAPEIDASTGVSAIALVAGALLVLRGRSKK